MAATRPPPPYCEVSYMNGTTFVKTVSDPNTPTYQLARPLTAEQCTVYHTPPEGMIRMQIIDTDKVVKAFVANTVLTKLITTTMGSATQHEITGGATGLATVPVVNQPQPKVTTG